MKSNLILNEFGKRVWKHKTNKKLFLEKPYAWKENMHLLDETIGRKITPLPFHEYEFDFSEWESMTKFEYDLVVYKYCEVYKREERLDYLLGE